MWWFLILFNVHYSNVSSWTNLQPRIVPQNLLLLHKKKLSTSSSIAWKGGKQTFVAVQSTCIYDYHQTRLRISYTWPKVGWLCWGLTSQSTIFQSYWDGAIASWVINQYFRGVKCLAQGHNTAAVGLEPRTSRSGVRHSTTEPPRSPYLAQGGRLTNGWCIKGCMIELSHVLILVQLKHKETFSSLYETRHFLRPDNF